MTQSIIVQVGQCGNQIGYRFWDLALREYAHLSKSNPHDEAVQSFFSIASTDTTRKLYTVRKSKETHALKARAVLIDMEEGVVNQLLKGPLQDVFDCKQLLTSYSGSGNNWATGHHYYGTKYHDDLLNVIRIAAEKCDCLQTFFILHSVGGGTGSGLGTSILEMLENEFPEVYRFVIAVYPSDDDDVITSPYNTLLATWKLTNHADCVIPIDNQSLLDICTRVSFAEDVLNKRTNFSIVRRNSCITFGQSESCKNHDKKPFNKMNNIIANVILNLTSSSRFDGTLNVDLNEITMNLVPFPQLHYLMSSITPLYSMLDVHLPVRRVDEMFTDAFSSKCQLVQMKPVTQNMYLACALLARGNITLSDIRRNITRLKSKLNLISWNADGWKTGLCSVPPVGQQHSLLTLSNNTCLQALFANVKQRFHCLYRKKVEGMELNEFQESIDSISHIIKEYRELETDTECPPFPLKVLPKDNTESWST